MAPSRVALWSKSQLRKCSNAFAEFVATELEDREDAGLRDEYIERIRQDVESDRKAVGHRSAFFEAVQSYSNQTYRDSELGVVVYLLRQQVKFANEVLKQIPGQP